jgi:hypothetical protein
MLAAFFRVPLTRIRQRKSELEEIFTETNMGVAIGRPLKGFDGVERISNHFFPQPVVCYGQSGTGFGYRCRRSLNHA